MTNRSILTVPKKKRNIVAPKIKLLADMLANVGMTSHYQIDHPMTTLLSKIITISVGRMTSI